MNLIDENEEQEQAANQKKIVKIIIITIAVLVLIGVILAIYSVVKKKNTLKFEVDGTSKTITSGMFYSEDSKNIYVDENNNIYISVKKLAATLGVEYFNDEYKNKGEDTSKCYIKTENEYTSYISGSSEIYKAIIVDEQQETGTTETTNNKNNKNIEEKKITEFEYFNIENGVRNINGEIYASSEAIELGFNVRVAYDKSNKDVQIITLDGLEQIAQKQLANASVTPVTGDECGYQNRKLLKYGLVMIKNAQNCYGVANYYNYSDGNYVLSCKYSSIRFCEDTGNLNVITLADEKQGVMKLDLDSGNKVETLIEPNYQLIKRMDEDLDIYLVKSSGKYGIIKVENNEVETVLRPEYQQIGLDKIYENMNNEYIINDKYIPIKVEDQWGIASVDGDVLIKPQFQGIGCDLGDNASGEPVVILPELLKGDDAIVCLVDREVPTYSIINVRTCTKIGLDGAEIYSIYEKNNREYFLKIVYDQGSSIPVNIYKQFGDTTGSSNNSTGTTNSTGGNNTTNNSVSNDNQTINTTNNATSSNNQSNDTTNTTEANQ